MTKHNYTDAEAIHDLEAIRDYFVEQSGGSAPMCFDYAINAIKERAALQSKEDAQ